MNIRTTTQNIHICRVQFPEIKLQTRDAHKLRGYFGELFKAYSPILHNHYEDGRFRYRYPVVQYKVLQTVPTLIGINEGAKLLSKLFLKINTLDINGIAYKVNTKNIQYKNEAAGYSNNLHEYRFATLWMALNQDNYGKYKQLNHFSEKMEMLNTILVGHILSFFSNTNIRLLPEERLMIKLHVQEKSTNFKENKMIAFSGKFIANALLPEGIGLGKSVARGFGTLTSVN